MEKICKKCNISKLLDEFYKNKSKFDNLDIYCKICVKEKTKIYRRTHKKELTLKHREYFKSWKLKNSEKIKQWNINRRNKYQQNILIRLKKKEYRQKHQQKINEYLHIWRQNHFNYMSLYMKQRRINNPGLVKTEERLKDIKRKQSRILSAYYQIDINKIYENCPKNYVVDHIIPLQGKNISGLHVPWNLQYLTIKQNNYKRNKFDFTYNNQDWIKNL